MAIELPLCKTCGAARVNRPGNKSCSRLCANRAIGNKRRIPRKPCVVCQVRYPKRPESLTCSTSCGNTLGARTRGAELLASAARGRVASARERFLRYVDRVRKEGELAIAAIAGAGDVLTRDEALRVYTKGRLKGYKLGYQTGFDKRSGRRRPWPHQRRSDALAG